MITIEEFERVARLGTEIKFRGLYTPITPVLNRVVAKLQGGDDVLILAAHTGGYKGGYRYIYATMDSDVRWKDVERVLRYSVMLQTHLKTCAWLSEGAILSVHGTICPMSPHSNQEHAVSVRQERW